jgi:CRP-like cAMP-binding protein
MTTKGEPNGNFFRISHEVFKSERFKKLRPSSKVLYMTLCHLRNRYGDKDGIFYRTDRDLAEDSGLSLETVSESKKDLIKSRFLKWKKGTSHRACRYQIAD